MTANLNVSLLFLFIVAFARYFGHGHDALVLPALSLSRTGVQWWELDHARNHLATVPLLAECAIIGRRYGAGLKTDHL